MRKIHLRCVTFYLLLWLLLCVGRRATAQEPWTWEQVRLRFEQNNPTLLADRLSIDESRAEEITAYLRPNPTFTLSADGTQLAPHRTADGKDYWRPFAGPLSRPASAICTNGGTSESCAWRAQKKGL